MKKLIAVLLICLSLGIQAQTSYKDYSWNTLPPKGTTDTIKSVNGVVGLMERRITEVYLNRNNIFEELSVLHKKIKVETQQAIDMENKIYVPTESMLEIVKLEARFISSGGKITNLKKENIKQVENLENNGNFQTFAIEGAELGGQIEYYYVLRKQLSPYGGIHIQQKYPQGDISIIYTYPAKLDYIIKSYNGLPAFVKSTSDDDMVTMKSEAPYVPALESEPYSYYKAGLMSFEYTLAYNQYRSSLRIYSWKNACTNIYNNTIALEKKEKSAASSWLKKMNLPNDGIGERIRLIENTVKSEISVSEQIKQTLDVKEIIRNKQANRKGILRLFIALFEAAGIEYELVVTGDMSKHPFDPDFNCFNFMDNYLVYFPGINNYIVPEDADYRLGVIPPNLQGGYGLFMKPMSFDEDNQSLSFDLNKIPVTPCFNNADTLVQTVKVDIAQSQLRIDMQRAFYGELGQNFQSFWTLLPKEKKDEVLKSLFNMGTENIVVNSYQVRNEKPSDIGSKPLIWKLDISANDLLESAGQDLIVSIGQTIGTQSELYQETARKLPINVGELHSYYRDITFLIPDGYTAKDVSDLNMRIEMQNKGKTSCIFTSSAEIKGDRVVIHSTEYYAESSYPVSRYEEFRKVINAAADFNKKKIILTKK